MNKLLLGLGLVALFVYSINSMSFQPSISIPTKFTLETIVKTALDNVTVSNIARTATFVAGIGLLYQAARQWARSAATDDIKPLPTDIQKTNVTQDRLKSALRYLIGGCIFTAAGLIHSYRNELAQGVKLLFKGTKNPS